MNRKLMLLIGASIALVSFAVIMIWFDQTYEPQGMFGAVGLGGAALGLMFTVPEIKDGAIASKKSSDRS